MPDLPDSLLVITRASHAAVRAAVGGDLDVRRFRTNLLVDLDAEPYAEEGWAAPHAARRRRSSSSCCIRASAA